MKKLLIALVLALPTGALAEHVDVIEVELNEGCSVSTYVAIKNDFNENWAKEYGYHAEVLVPIQSHNLVSLFWVGRSADTGAFGKAWEQWRADLQDADSVASQLWARFVECSTNIGRRSYNTN